MDVEENQSDLSGERPRLARQLGNGDERHRSFRAIDFPRLEGPRPEGANREVHPRLYRELVTRRFSGRGTEAVSLAECEERDRVERKELLELRAKREEAFAKAAQPKGDGR